MRDELRLALCAARNDHHFAAGKGSGLLDRDEERIEWCDAVERPRGFSVASARTFRADTRVDSLRAPDRRAACNRNTFDEKVATTTRFSGACDALRERLGGVVLEARASVGVRPRRIAQQEANAALGGLRQPRAIEALSAARCVPRS